MLRRLFEGLKSGAMKAFSVIKEPLRRVGSFIKQNHQPLAVLTNAITSQSDNPYVRALGSTAVAGSAYLSSKNIGNNYFNLQQPATT